MTVDLQWEENGVAVRYSGPLTPADALRSASRISADERMGSLRYVLLDFREVERCELGPEGARALDSSIAIAIGVAYSNPDILIGVIVPVLADCATLREVLAETPYPHEFFATEHEALDWIWRVRARTGRT